MYSWLPAFSVMSHPYRLLLKLGKNPPIPCEEFREHAVNFVARRHHFFVDRWHRDYHQVAHLKNPGF